ncbi:hypothetical protein TVAG_391900 [Trichomonas vaginalis G3]|uniref:Uncharacterized protein n=1 Tax=Trichomonas vaginalis (strain ATCC PRA-98 / G3) TaxID=412133 RepID=A2DFV3_TRIV3|nr:hypothetical protein TVAGG3_0322700 [Trichomonas vaginalis G3]EAY20806.1 hypothetical protein TVAG_391900 [Trichomonas vaginalis G3]KAI5529420.1 hypothetical protein TVAGG3_0322700 [Trichomonas vaginalis G3]|eukprot:XP_001581792.1 hypothetical protein [Trichomonas vaginalis G3]
MVFTLKDLFQIQGALYIILVIGFVLAIFKVFTAPEVWPLYEVIRLSSYSAMAYNIIGNTKLTMENWKPYFPIAIAQLIIYLLIVIATFAIKSKSKLTAYIRFATSFAFQESTVFIYQILDVVFPTKYKVIAVMYLITEEFIYLPILKILMFVYSHTPKEQDDQEEPQQEEEEDSLQE